MDRRPSHPVINYALLALGSAIAAFAVEEFLVPNTILDGGVIGVGMMISHVSGIPLALLTIILNAPFVILGGIKSISKVCEKLVPVMAVFYVVCCLIIIGMNGQFLGEAIRQIIVGAFTPAGAAGGAVGSTITLALQFGFKRGIFSYESGLGSAPLVASSATTKNPARQALVSMTGTFLDTIVVCTMTAIVVLSSGYIDLETGLAVAGVDDATLVARAFGNVFGPLGEKFVALAMLLFAFTTVLGWSQYGTKAVEYLFGEKATKIYKVIFVVMILSGAVMTSSLAWDISDTFNGLMMLPNLIGVVVLCPMVMKITKNYVNRKIKGIPEEPVLSHFPDIQAEAAASQTDEV